VNRSPVICYPCTPVAKVHFMLIMLGNDTIFIVDSNKLTGMVRAVEFVLRNTYSALWLPK